MLLPMFKRELVLRPNCLITRRPIYLLTGPRSIFYYRSPWKALQYYLVEHGYKVFVFKLPFQVKAQRESFLKAMKSKLNQAHVMCDATTYQELKPVLEQLSDSTITILSDYQLINLPDHTFQIVMDYKVFSSSYSLHQAYLKLRNINTPSASEVGLKIPSQTYNKILDHCVKLAEIDFYDLDLNTQS
jgi:hypothetical protein